MLKRSLLPTLVVLAVLCAIYGIAAGAANSHALLYAGLCASFFASDRSLWSRS